MNLFGKRLEEVTEADLQSLVENRVRESLYVEYKREMHRSSDDQKREFLKDVSALANAQGGHLIIGVEEEEGYPSEILGIDEAERESQAAIQLCNTCIQERLQGLKVVPIELANGKSVLVIEVPPSIRKPHMVSFKGKSYFWKRHDDHILSMTLDEIRYDVIQGKEMLEKTKERIDELGDLVHLTEFINIFTQIIISPIYSQNNLISTLLPDVKEEMNSLVDSTEAVQTDISSLDSPRHFLGGVEREEQIDGYPFSRLRFFVDGLIEYTSQAIRCEQATESCFKARYLSDLVINAIGASKQLYEKLNIQGPFTATVNIFSKQNPLMVINDRTALTYQEEKQIGRFYLAYVISLIPIEFQDFASPSLIARNLMDGIFRAYHRDNCPYFDKDGNYSSLKKS